MTKMNWVQLAIALVSGGYLSLSIAQRVWSGLREIAEARKAKIRIEIPETETTPAIALESEGEETDRTVLMRFCQDNSILIDDGREAYLLKLQPAES